MFEKSVASGLKTLSEVKKELTYRAIYYMFLITDNFILANGIPSPNASTSGSRRNSTSSTLKCDNVTKYPDKKQIEDKLNQIREYLQITTSLMTSMKSTDDQVCENGSDNTSDNGFSKRNEEQDYDLLREQQQLIQLKQKAENKIRGIRHVQENLSCAHYANAMTNSYQRDAKNSMSMADIDAAISELEERARKINQPSRHSNQDRILSEVETLHNRIVSMHNANNEREQLIEVLDNRDAELKSQQVELQDKLTELQSKKSQIDNLVVQLQSLASEDGDQVGPQVRKIVTMKEQLKKLKDMLEIVKTTENVMSNTNTPNDAQEDTLQFQKHRSNSNDSNIPSDALSQKQVNKNSKEQSKQTKSQTGSINEKLVLQAELEAKKKELEEIMGKHKAGTSNLNHDVGIDTKSEFSCTSNTVNGRSFWPHQSEDNNSDRFSSDGIEDDDYPDFHNNRNVHTLPVYPTIKSSKGSDNNPEFEFPGGRLQSMYCTPETNVHDNSSSICLGIHEQPRANNAESEKLQKQLQIIKSMCDSMLEQHNSNNQQSNVQHLRNNLTPSPLYSEPRYVSSNPLNISNINMDMPCISNCNQNGNIHDVNCQGWLATNTLQTQSFMLNTLNQCCQMMWLQQRDLASLRNTLSVLQERIEGSEYQHHNPHSSLHPNQQPLSHPQPSPKPNQVSAACSMPNLNHYNVSPSNLDVYSNVHGRLLDPCPNNINGIANNVPHSANANLNQPLWHGQALNNQVPPGNRANNYWDNFRSYSRQNLLSTKNSEGFQNPTSSFDRSNTGSDRTNPFTLMSFSKSNSEQGSSTSQDTTPQRQEPFKWHPNSNMAVPVHPPYVPQTNRPKDEQDEWMASGDDLSLGLNVLLNLNSNDTASFRSEECIGKEGLPKPVSRRSNNGTKHAPQKSKLFEELRDNVYKEVASLISANEARPHFLIQLFRDLQMIGSDTLRLKILQSIQSVLTNSLMSSPLTQQPVESQQPKENENSDLEEHFSFQSMTWRKPSSNLPGTSRNMQSLISENVDIDSTFKKIISFLNEHDDEVIQQNFLINLKQVFLESECLKGNAKDSIFRKHISNVLDEELEQYCDKSVQDVKIRLIQTLHDLLKSELSFIQLIQETNPDPFSIATNDATFCEQLNISPSFNQKVENIQNGDLAEADQTRAIDNMEEIGAVGGIIEVKDANGMNITEEMDETCCDMDLVYMHVSQEVEVKSLSKGNSEEILNMPSMEFQCSSEGLDQVPTRLPIKSKSRSSSKSKSRSASPSTEEQ